MVHIDRILNARLKADWHASHFKAMANCSGRNLNDNGKPDSLVPP